MRSCPPRTVAPPRRSEGLRGRDHERALLDELAASIRRGESRALVVRGEAEGQIARLARDGSANRGVAPAQGVREARHPLPPRTGPRAARALCERSRRLIRTPPDGRPNNQ